MEGGGRVEIRRPGCLLVFRQGKDTQNQAPSVTIVVLPEDQLSVPRLFLVPSLSYSICSSSPVLARQGLLCRRTKTLRDSHALIPAAHEM
jgi:hypothetical protein